MTDTTAERLFQMFFLKPEKSDVSFRVVDDDNQESSTVFVAHRTIVTARCEVLCRMLTNERFKEANMETPQINGTTPDAFKALLYFLYTEHTLDGVEDSLVDILQVCWCLSNLFFPSFIIFSLRICMAKLVC